MKLILASNSPRRRQLLEEAGIPFEVIPSSFEEAEIGLSSKETVLQFAAAKAMDVYQKHPDCAVLGADTVVSLDGETLGKPGTEERAKEMLSLLSGRKHQVYTGVCLICDGGARTGIVETGVTFHELSKEQIEEYVKKMRPFDKAGGYGIQDDYPLVKLVEGSFTNVVGLPMELVTHLLKEAKLW